MIESLSLVGLVEMVNEPAVVDLSKIMRVPNLERADEVDVGMVGHVEIIDIPNRQRMGIRLCQQKPAPLLVEIFHLVCFLQVKQRSELAAEDFAHLLAFCFKKMDRLDQRLQKS